MTMAAIPSPMSLEQQIDQWRGYVRHRQAIRSADAAELEDHLREQIAGLVEGGLDPDEAFLVAVKRMGSLDALSREFAREHSDRLWKQLVLPAGEDAASATATRRDAVRAFGFAFLAALLVKFPALFGLDLVKGDAFYAHNAAFFVLPLLAAYFAIKRGMAAGNLRWVGAAFVAGLVAANAYSFGPHAATERLLALHLPIALWLAVGVAYAGGRWGQVEGRMDFVRFSGELFIYYVLIALGGGVLTGFMAMIFQAIGVKIEPFLQGWLLPCGAAAAVLVASWLVEAKQSVVENMAPVLTRLFSPLFVLVLVAFLGTVLFTGRGLDVERNVLIGFDLLLAVVIALLLYSISARDPRQPPGLFDAVQVALVASALLVDGVALWAVAGRIHEFGYSPNRVAALGENIVLLVSLAGTAVLYARFMAGRGTFGAVERWQTDYLPIYAAWAAVVAVVFPPVFGFR